MPTQPSMRQATGGKPWKYALIPHDVINDNMIVLGLAERYQRG